VLVGGSKDLGDSGDSFRDDVVFIRGLPETVTEERLAEHFADAGTIKVSLRLCVFILCLRWCSCLLRLTSLQNDLLHSTNGLQ